MNAVLAVDKGLPPGLWLPTPDEPTDKFLVEHFNHGKHPYEEVIELGIFTVTLACFDEERRNHGSLMPTEQDLRELYNAGYGLNRYQIDNNYGGYARLQKALGFYPRDYWPKEEDLKERLQWMADHSLAREDHFAGSRDSVEDILSWGKRRDLLPSRAIMEKVLGKDLSTVRTVFAIERPKTQERYTVMDAYKMAAEALRRNNGLPVTQVQFNEMFAAECEVRPYQIVGTFCGSMRSLWREFGFITETGDMDRNDLISAGVRHMIQSGNPTITKPLVERLSAAKKFPSMQPIRKEFQGSIAVYRDAVTKAYETYLAFEAELIEQGVSREVCALASRKYEVGEEYTQLLTNNVNVLTIISGESESAQYVRTVIARGFDLEHELTMEMQLIDLKAALKKLGITTESGTRFIFELIPAVSFEDIES